MAEAEYIFLKTHLERKQVREHNPWAGGKVVSTFCRRNKRLLNIFVTNTVT
jgi:hypothetical protein